MAHRQYGHGQYGHDQNSYDPSGYSQQPQQYQQQYQTAGHPAPVTQPTPPQASGPNWRWWIRPDGIRRDVIQADIQRYLGQDALVKPGLCTRAMDPENEGRQGYVISAYRNLTTEMVQDLRTDSANFERSGARGTYQESTVHQSRQYWGPSGAEQPASVAPPLQSYASPPAQQSSYNQPQVSQPASRQPQYTTAAQAPAYTYDNQSTAQVQQPAYGATPAAYNTSPASNTSTPGNYVYAPSGGPSGYPPSNGRQPEANTVPRDSRYNTQASQPPYAQPTASTTHQTSQVPAGYYLASDGRYYPSSQRPT